MNGESATGPRQALNCYQSSARVSSEDWPGTHQDSCTLYPYPNYLRNPCKQRFEGGNLTLIRRAGVMQDAGCSESRAAVEQWSAEIVMEGGVRAVGLSDRRCIGLYSGSHSSELSASSSCISAAPLFATWYLLFTVPTYNHVHSSGLLCTLARLLPSNILMRLNNEYFTGPLWFSICALC